jgi:PTS system mannitol-specific IIC component
MTGINRIIFACDAGMGSSAMGASILRKKVKEAGLPQNVSNSAINNLTDDANTLIVTQEELQERAKQKAPNATFVAVENFLNSPRYDEIVATLSGTKTAGELEKKSEAGNQADVPSANDLKQVSEIILAHDDRKGSATMAQKVFQDLLAKEALTMPIRKSHINDLHANASSLVITKEALTPQAQTSAPEAIHLSVNNLMGTTNYQRIVASIKAAN